MTDNSIDLVVALIDSFTARAVRTQAAHDAELERIDKIHGQVQDAARERRDEIKATADREIDRLHGLVKEAVSQRDDLRGQVKTLEKVIKRHIAEKNELAEQVDRLTAGRSRKRIDPPDNAS